MGRRKEHEGALVSYRLYKQDLELLDNYAKQLNTSRSKIVSYFLYELMVKKGDIQYIRNVIEESSLTKQLNKKQLTGNINLYVRKETKRSIDELRSQLYEETGKRLNRNLFIGALVTFQLHKQIKKKLQKGLTPDDLKPKQVAIYLKKSLYEKVIHHVETNRLSIQLLLLDCLEDPELENGLPYYRDQQEEGTEDYERIITLLPNYLYEKIKQLPIHLTFLASIQLQKHLDKYAVKG